MQIRIATNNKNHKDVRSKLSLAGYHLGQEFNIADEMTIPNFGWPLLGLVMGNIFKTGLNVMLYHTNTEGHPLAILWVGDEPFKQID